MNIREMGALLRSGKTSASELVEQALQRAKQREELRAFITIIETEARAEAAERDRELRSGVDRGPLHGIPVALKDLIYTKGVRTTGGSPLFQNFFPVWDADVVTHLRKAGAISIGKTNLHELAFGITSRNPHFGPVLHPIAAERLPGGSSGGSGAAIAASIVPMALGTDTGGSIRIPASYCGIVGLKPTYGLVSRRGVLPLAFTLDHVGPMGFCVEDCALAMNAIADRKEDFNLPPFTGLKGVRIGVPRNFFFDDVDEAVAAPVKAAVSVMERAGAEVVEIVVPDFAELNTVSHIVILAEFASLHVNNKRDQFGPDVWSLLEQGRMIAGHEYVNAQRLRTVFREEMDRVWQKVDVLATPTTPIVAPRVDAERVTVNGLEETVRAATTRLVRGINCLGEPALSMPCGQGESALPVGLQLISPPFTDARLLQIAKSLEGMLER